MKFFWHWPKQCISLKTWFFHKWLCYSEENYTYQTGWRLLGLSYDCKDAPKRIGLRRGLK
jgi:hypothetical protein